MASSSLERAIAHTWAYDPRPNSPNHGLTYSSHDFSGGGESSFGLCPGVRFVTTRVASIGKSFEIDDQPLSVSHGVSIINTVLHCWNINILSLALSWALWCCLYCTHVILLSVEPRLKRIKLRKMPNRCVNCNNLTICYNPRSSITQFLNYVFSGIA